MFSPSLGLVELLLKTTPLLQTNLPLFLTQVNFLSETIEVNPALEQLPPAFTVDALATAGMHKQITVAKVRYLLSIKLLTCREIEGTCGSKS